MNFAASLTILDAERLQQSAKATIQNNGRLSFTAEASRLMHLDDNSSIIIFSAENGDLGAVVSEKDDKRAFDLKKAGAYHYLTFKNYLQEAGINYKTQKIIYDITELDEKLENRTLYRFARRILPREAKVDTPDEETNEKTDTPTENNPPMPPPADETPTDSTGSPTEADISPCEDAAPPPPPDLP